MTMGSKFAMAIAATTMVAGAALAAPDPATYVKKAGASDLYEITSSKLVMHSSNPKLRQFATQMVSDHTKSTAEVKAAAMKSGLHPKPPMLEPKQQTMITQLKGVSGAARDHLYISQQKTAHQEALALHRDYHATGTAAPLKMTAGKIVPVVEHHIHDLSTM